MSPLFWFVHVRVYIVFDLLECWYFNRKKDIELIDIMKKWRMNIAFLQETKWREKAKD